MEIVIETTERLLAVLAALQSRARWSGPELATHLGVTIRTIRRDVDRLRSLGYAVESDTGTTGGYRLGVGGAASPPLMLDPDEAVAIAISLRATVDRLGAIDDVVARVLTKLEQITPARVRPHVTAIESATVALPHTGESIDPAVFVAISRAGRSGDVVRIDYVDGKGRSSERSIEPFRSVHAGRRWYLVARDRDAARRGDDDGWRTLRLDRITNVRETGHRADRTAPPDPVTFVQRAISVSPYAHRATIELDAPIEQLTQQIPSTVGLLEQLDDERTLFTTGADDLDTVAMHLVRLDIAFRVIEPVDFAARLATLAERLMEASARSVAGSDVSSTADQQQ